jgi:hypothetical protein
VRARETIFDRATFATFAVLLDFLSATFVFVHGSDRRSRDLRKNHEGRDEGRGLSH